MTGQIPAGYRFANGTPVLNTTPSSPEQIRKKKKKDERQKQQQEADNEMAEPQENAGE
jgi:hypothetical protein